MNITSIFSRLRYTSFGDWFTRYWRSLCIVLFVAFSVTLIALVSTVAWSYYNGVVGPRDQLKNHGNVEVPDEEFLSEQWDSIEGRSPGPERPSFVNSDSSELNFDELENSNSVNSALMHPLNSVQMEDNNFMGPSEQESEYGKSNDALYDTNSKLNNYFSSLPTENPKLNPASSKEKLDFFSEQQQPMTLYRVTKAVKAGAVCLDGSAPAYYHRPGIGPNERSWIIHFNGGAWCFDANACIERSHSSLGSTNKLPKSPPIIQGINSPNPVVNPDFYDWNLVWVVYCDGASFTGNLEKPITTKSGQTIYLRGKRVLNAIINDLLYNRGFQFAESVILTGSSAGSMAAIFQADYIASKFPPNIPVRVLADAGFFIDTASIGGKSLPIAFKKIFEMQNSSAGLNQDCVRERKKEAWKCFLPTIATQYVKTPMFVLNSAYDIWALIYFLGIDCKFPSTGENIQRKRRGFPAKIRRDVSGFEMRPFFRSYIAKAHEQVKKVISIIGAKSHPKKNTHPVELKNTTIHITSRTQIDNKTLLNQTDHSSILDRPHVLGKTNMTFVRPSIVVITSNSTPVSNATLTKLDDLNTAERVKKTKVKKPDVSDSQQKSSFADNLKGVEDIIPEQIKKLQMMSDETQSTLQHEEVAGETKRKSNTPKPGKSNTTKPALIRSEAKRRHLRNFSIPVDSHGNKKNAVRHVLKQRRSTSIAREYINILRSDPPECTSGEMNKALQYRDAILRETATSLSPDSGRFIVSCIDHSMSLFDETWNGIKVNGKSIQQAFGDWFFNRVTRDKSSLIDCKYPCNLSCP